MLMSLCYHLNVTKLKQYIQGYKLRYSAFFMYKVRQNIAFCGNVLQYCLNETFVVSEVPFWWRRTDILEIMVES